MKSAITPVESSTRPSVSGADWLRWLMIEKSPAFLQKLSQHFKTQIVAYALLACLSALFLKHYTIGINATFSLPHTFYLVERNATVTKGDFASFTWHGGGPYAKGKSFVKQIIGAQGDIVTQADRQFYVNGQPVGLAKPYSRAGIALELGPTGVIPKDRFYVATPHLDSLDSRYAITGWIDKEQMLGKVVWKW
jgi:conjugal transfer pilin signal peptidase TrbI